MRRVKQVVVIIAVVLWVMITACRSALCAPMTFEKEYTYQASDFDSKMSCRTIALEQVKRLLLEQFGTYLQSSTEVKDYQLSKDQITSITAGIVGVEIIDEKWDGKTYYVKAKVSADPDEVARSVKDVKKDSEKMDELEETRKQSQTALDEIEKLKKDIAAMKTQLDDQKKKKYEEQVVMLETVEMTDQGNVLASSGKYDEAEKFYEKSAEKVPRTAAWAQLSKARVLAKQGKNKLALAAYSKAIHANPDLSIAYFERSAVFKRIGKDRLALADLKKAADLGHKRAQVLLKKIQKEK